MKTILTIRSFTRTHTIPVETNGFLRSLSRSKWRRAGGLRASVLLAALTYWGPGSPCNAQLTAVPLSVPSIISQPVSKTAEYGSDVSFSVTVSATAPASYQWQKNGEDLIDYDNVAGSRGARLSLIGVAANDLGNYSVIVSSLGGGSVTSAVAVLTINSKMVFADNFENGSANWSPLFDSNPLANSSAQNHTESGSASLAMSNASQKVYHNLPVQYACRIRFSFWFYDDGQSQTSCGGELRGYTGPGYAKYSPPGGLTQMLAIGRVNSASAGTNAGQPLSSSLYQGYVLRGTNTGWFNLNAARSAGWHQFLIDRSGSGAGKVNFYVDGRLAGSVSGVNMAAVESIFLGAVGSSQSSSNAQGVAYFDDVEVDAFPGLFDWQNLATAGVIPDWMQARETGANPQIIDVTPVTVAQAHGASTNGSLGAWAIDGAGIYSTGIRGFLDYSVTTTADDAYRIEIEGREHNYRDPPLEMPIEVSIDGEALGRLNLPYGPQTNGMLHCFTPFIRAGSHSIRLAWDNVDPRRSLYVQAVRLQSLTTPNDPSSGLRAWVANRLIAQSGIESCPATSLVSPACIEGRGQYLSMMTILAGPLGQLTPAGVQHGAGYRWYVNVPLAASNATIIAAAYQNGALIETNQITWQPCNLLSVTNNVVIRQGDSLLLSASPEGLSEGEVVIAIGGTTLTTDALTPVPYQFNQPGSFIVTGSYVGSTNAVGSTLVTVVGASLESSPIARVFHARYWDCTNLPPQVVVDADPRLTLTLVSAAERAQQTPALPPAGPNEREFRVRTRSSEPQYVLARLGTNGPVLANVAVRGFRWSVAPDTYLRRVAINPDGSQVVETAFAAGPLFPSLTVAVQVISGGVTLDDGTLTRNLAYSDFDATGICRLQFIRAATAKGSACHTTHIYDNGTLIGWR